MNRYTIYCTEEQTEKAYKLGAPLEEFCGLRPTTSIDGIIYDIPTAEQMIAWLEEQEGIKEIFIYLIKTTWYYAIIKSNATATAIECDDYYPSRKEATIAAIDAALEYLMTTKLSKI